jgi:tetratricopeptide (TPR) repeat protein
LLAVLLLALLGAAAAPSPPSAYRDAKALCDAGDWNKAGPAIDEMLAAFRMRDDDDVWRLRILRGRVWIGQGESKLALDTVTPALPKRLKNDVAAVNRLSVMAIASYKLNDKKAARADALEAVKLAKAHQPALAASMLVLVVNMDAFSAEERLRAGNEALHYLRRFPDVKTDALVSGALAFMYARQERFDEAIPVGQRALQSARENHLDAKIEALEGNLGWCYFELGDSEQAEEYLRDALTVATRVGAKGDVIPWYLQLGNIAAQRDDFASAMEAYRQALALAEKYDLSQRGAALANMAAIAIDQHNYDEARRYNERALAAKNEAKDATGILRSRILDARINRLTGHLDEAQHALDQISETSSPFVTFEAEAELARVAVARNAAAAADQHFRSAVTAIDKARDEIKTDELKLAFPSLTASLCRDYVDFLVASGRSRDALRVAELSRARTLAEGLGVEHDRPGEIDPEAIARKANVTVLSYWLAPHRSFLFVVTPEGVSHFVLPEAAAINEKIDAYQKDLNNQRRGSELYSMLVGPAAAAIRGNRITVIPDGHLAAFNFETLVTPKGQYWIEDVALESANALQFVSAPKSAGRGKMLLIGNAPKADQEFPPLPHAAEEIAGIEKYFDQRTTLAGTAATPAAYVKSNPESYSYIHFVAHAAATRQRPLDSAVILGRDQNGYKLYARDVVAAANAHPLKARLVTISSCHSAGKRAFAGEGLVGLAWAFLRAGAHQVVAALWEVNDASTVKLMDSMYHGIHAGLPPVDALRAAKLNLLRSNSYNRKPQYWAPFVLYSGS